MNRQSHRGRQSSVIRRWLAAGFAGAVLSASLASAQDGGVIQRPVCPIAGQSDGIERGVNRTNLSWDEHWRAKIDEIAVHRIAAIRLTLHYPVERSAEIAAYAHRRGLRVLVNVLLSLGDYYDPAVQPRAGNQTIRAVRRLSDIDIGRYRDSMSRFLAATDRHGGRLSAIEVGNEINWADFNGDLPVGPVGIILDEAAVSGAGADPRLLEGFRKYRQVLDATRALLRASAAGKEALVMSAGLYGPSDWTIGSGGSALTLPAAQALFDRFGITKAADAIAVHVYPPTKATGEDAFATSLNSLRAATAICGGREGGKPCFVTEWGFPAGNAAAEAGDAARLAQFRAFEAALSCLDRARDLRASYLYTWDEDPSFAVQRNGRLTGDGAIFADPPMQ